MDGSLNMASTNKKESDAETTRSFDWDQQNDAEHNRKRKNITYVTTVGSNRNRIRC